MKYRRLTAWCRACGHRVLVDPDGRYARHKVRLPDGWSLPPVWPLPECRNGGRLP